MNESAFLKDLADAGIATDDAIREFGSRFKGQPFALLQHLLSLQPKKRDTLGRLWGDQLDIGYVDPAKTIVNNELCRRLPERFAKSQRVLALYELGGAVTVAMAQPENKELVAEAERHLDAFVSPVFAFPDQLDTALEIAYQTDVALAKLLDEFSPRMGQDGAKIGVADLQRWSKEQAIVDFTRGLIFLALRRRASDVHIEPGSDQLTIRFRIDGVLLRILNMELSLLAPIVSRLKVMAQLNISETRRPQDGRIEVETASDTVPLRFSSVPTIYGEKVVLRLMGHSDFQDIPDLSELGFSVRALDHMQPILKATNGIFFVSGPTGSGKSTTLYAVLKSLNDPGVNIMTAENPVEFSLPGANQVQVDDGIGLSFTTVLRHFLRQDPDIILLGEIRDLEAARVAARAALTGHLVLTTMHTNDALQAITRMIELGVEPSLAAPAIVGSMAQRLVRRLCENCKRSYELTADEKDDLFEWDGQTRVFMQRASGCPVCDQSGYRGQTAIHELFYLNADARRLVAHGVTGDELLDCAVATGYRPMRHDGMKKVLRGITSIIELDRVTYAE